MQLLMATDLERQVNAGAPNLLVLALQAEIKLARPAVPKDAIIPTKRFGLYRHRGCSNARIGFDDFDDGFRSSSGARPGSEI